MYKICRDFDLKIVLAFAKSVLMQYSIAKHRNDTDLSQNKTG